MYIYYISYSFLNDNITYISSCFILVYSRIRSLVRILGQVEWVGGVIGVENQRGGSPVTSRVSRVAIKSQRSVAGRGGREERGAL